MDSVCSVGCADNVYDRGGCVIGTANGRAKVGTAFKIEEQVYLDSGVSRSRGFVLRA